MATTSKTAKLIAKLRAGKKLTAQQIAQQCGFECVNTAYSTISTLRENGYKVLSAQNKEGLNQYYMK